MLCLNLNYRLVITTNLIVFISCCKIFQIDDLKTVGKYWINNIEYDQLYMVCVSGLDLYDHCMVINNAGDISVNVNITW